jgi:hypothetical protein
MAILGGKGSGVSFWDPSLIPNLLQPGIPKDPNQFILSADLTTSIDKVPPSQKGTIIFFDKKLSMWTVAAGAVADKGSYATHAELTASLPTGVAGWYAYVASTNTRWFWSTAVTPEAWTDSGSLGEPYGLQVYNNLSDLNDFQTARDNLKVHSKTEINDIVTALDVTDSAIHDRLDVIEGDNTVEGSIEKSLADSKAYTDTEIASSSVLDRARENHTGTQLAETISDFTDASKSAVVDDSIASDITDKAPSQKAVYDQLATKEQADTTILKQANIADNLTTADATRPLSANQGVVIKSTLDTKVDKIDGKGLSKNDFTDALLDKLDNIEPNAKDDQQASEVPVTTITDLTATQVQQALEEIHNKVKTLAAQLNTALIFKGVHDITTDAFPSGAGSGYYYLIDGENVVDGVSFKAGDALVAITASPSETVYADNWFKIDNTDSVRTVYGRKGDIMSQYGDYTATQIQSTQIAGEISSENLQGALQEVVNKINEGKLKVSSNDTTKANLESKITQSTSIDKTINNEGDDESISLSLNNDLIANFSSGVVSGGVLSKGTTGTTISITAGRGVLVDSTDPNAIITNSISWTEKIDVSITNIATNKYTYIAIDSSGNVVQSASPFDAQDRLSLVPIGAVNHINNATVLSVDNSQVLVRHILSMLVDFGQALGSFNISGNTILPNGSNMSLDKTLGSIFRPSGNYKNNELNPNILSLGALASADLNYIYSDDSLGAVTTSLVTDTYDTGSGSGSLGSVPNNKFTVHRVYVDVDNNIFVHAPQSYHDSLSEAVDSIPAENFSKSTLVSHRGLLRAYIVTKKGATSLADENDCKIIYADKFGGTGSGGAGVQEEIIKTLQDVYNDSTPAEIETSNGAFSLKNGNVDDSAKVFNTKNNAGDEKFSIDGDGKVVGAFVGNKNTSSLVTVEGTPSENEIVEWGTDGARGISKADLKTAMSLENVDNTSDLDKPISTATQTALDLKADITGNVSTATKLETPRTISLSGDVSGSVSFDGSDDASITTTVADDSHNHVIGNVDGLQTALDLKADITGNVSSATKLETPRAIGGTNFDGTADIDLPGVNVTGNQDTTGNSATATKLETARTINGVSFDGTADITLPSGGAGGLGIDQTWQDVTSGRALYDTYTNTTGGPIVVSVIALAQYANTAVALLVDSKEVARSYSRGQSSYFADSVVAIVPNGSSYRMIGHVLAKWYELR